MLFMGAMTPRHVREWFPRGDKKLGSLGGNKPAQKRIWAILEAMIKWRQVEHGGLLSWYFGAAKYIVDRLMQYWQHRCLFDLHVELFYVRPDTPYSEQQIASWTKDNPSPVFTALKLLEQMLIDAIEHDDFSECFAVNVSNKTGGKAGAGIPYNVQEGSIYAALASPHDLQHLAEHLYKSPKFAQIMRA